MPDLLRKLSSGVHCTKCDTKLAFVHEDMLTFKGKLPFEVFAQPGSATMHIVCSQCGTLVPLDENMMVLH